MNETMTTTSDCSPFNGSLTDSPVKAAPSDDGKRLTVHYMGSTFTVRLSDLRITHIRGFKVKRSARSLSSRLKTYVLEDGRLVSVPVRSIFGDFQRDLCKTNAVLSARYTELVTASQAAKQAKVKALKKAKLQARIDKLVAERDED